MNIQTLSISMIERQRDTQARVDVNIDVIHEYMDALKEGAVFPPIKVVFDSTKYYIADGWHRFLAHVNVHKTDIDCEIIDGTKRDATLIALGANAEHGLRRSNADKRKAVMIMLKDPVWSIWSNVKIAETCKVGEALVRTIRGEIDTSFKTRYENEATPETRTFVHPKTGKETQMNITNMKRKEPEPDEEEEFEEVEIEEETEIEEEEEWIDEEEVKSEFERFQYAVLNFIEDWAGLNNMDDNPKVIKISNQIKQLFMLEEAE